MTAGGSACAGMRVLVVEDDFHLARLCARFIEIFGGVPVGPVPSMSRAEKLIASEAIDVALLDVRVSDGPVFPLAKRLRERSIPFVFASGFSEDSEFPREFSDAVRLAKPYTEEALANALRRVGH